MAPLSLKLVIDNSTEKVICAEAEKDFVDFLFGLLRTPLGSLIRDLAKEGMCQSWSLSKVYLSVTKLGDEYLQTEQTKQTLLNPNMPPSNTKGAPPFSTSSSSFGTTPGSFGTIPPNLFESAFGSGSGSFGCGSGSFGSSPSSFGSGSGSFGSSPSSFGPSPSSFGTSPGSFDFSGLFRAPRNDDRKEVNGYVKGSVTYMISDDLTVKPKPGISCVRFLKSLGVKDMDTVEEKIVKIDAKKALQLVKTSFESSTVLTDVFVGKTGKKCDTDE
ncbi:hypothetical protein DCAR_0415108 [Daucus carota subsp. sativus]|nr:PREDICTED: keratin, type II cytoskeletal 1-like [Daucus carota subsp. sativus]XP_017243739.1 PREDICTED: keratin, type II cytoskeletal 1-like [Daucus carota subsp. sativus]WOG95780.1 hypothetical protein DCAR_0415108 [Daucus carota subsp. sativus]